MTNQELFKQAIADAKSVRDAAVANAKAALEETFTPSIMNMLSAKLNELEEDIEEEGKKVEEEGKEMEEEGMETAIGYEGGKQKPQIEEKETEEEGYGLEEADLDEILAELEKEEGKMKEGKEDKEEGKMEEVEEAKKEDDKKEKVEESLEEAEGDDEITELTVDELKDIIRDVLKDVMGAEEEEAGEEEAGEEAPEGEEGEVEVDDETEINLDELLAELEMEEGKEKVEDVKEKEEDGKMEEVKKELEEAINTIQTLQSELNEVNLLNAKLLYTNKIFKAKSLNEAQKVSVLKAFDRAETVREVKTVYNTLAESFTSKTKQQQIKESVGFASKAVGVAPKQQIVEGDSAVLRMQQLAGIIK
jgi:hypothetical protein